MSYSSKILKVLITGAAGFVGSNLSRLLIRRGWHVLGLDNLSQGRLENLHEIQGHSQFQFIQGDVKDQALVSQLSAEIDVIVHLAAYKIPRYGNRLDTLTNNSQGMLHVLEAAKQHGCKVVFSSTSDVYGKNPEVPFQEHETDLVIGPAQVRRWAYAVSKLYDEHLCHGYMEAYDLPVVILRFFGSYGPYQHLDWWGGPQGVFIQAALAGEALEVHGDGMQTRCFCYVDDLVEGVARAIERDAAVGRTINLGTTEEVTIQGLAGMIWRLAGRDDEAKIRLIPYEQFGARYQDVRRRVPDLSVMHDVLGYDPQVSLADGLRRTIEWVRALRPVGHMRG